MVLHTQTQELRKNNLNLNEGAHRLFFVVAGVSLETLCSPEYCQPTQPTPPTKKTDSAPGRKTNLSNS